MLYAFNVADQALLKSKFLIPMLQFGKDQYNSRFTPQFRKGFGMILPKYMTSHSMFTFLNLVSYLCEYLKMIGYENVPLPMPQAHSQATFLMTYPRINPHSLRLYNFLRCLELSEDLTHPSEIQFLARCAQSRKITTWFNFRRCPISIKVNDREFTNFSISTESYFDSAVILPNSCSQQESIVLSRLGRHAPGFKQFDAILHPPKDDDFDDLTNEDIYDNFGYEFDQNVD